MVYQFELQYVIGKMILWYKHAYEKSYDSLPSTIKW